MPGGDEAGVAEGVDGLAVVELVVADGDGVVGYLRDNDSAYILIMRNVWLNCILQHILMHGVCYKACTDT